MTILDSDFIIAVLRGNKEAADCFSKIEHKKTTVVNLAELFRGAYKANNANNAQLVESFAGSIDAFNLTRVSARLAGEIQSSLEKEGQMIGLADVLIAAICIENNEELVTRNIKPFEKIKRLKLRKW